MSIGKLTVLLSLLALLLVGCGGADDTGDGGGTTGGGAVSGADDGTIVDGSIDAARCAQVVGAMAAAAQGSSAAMTGGTGDLDASVGQLEAFASEAPEEIRDDMVLIASAYATMIQAWTDAGYDPASGTPPTAEQAAALQQATASVNSAEFREASTNVTAWFQEECGT